MNHMGRMGVRLAVIGSAVTTMTVTIAAVML